MDIYKFRPIEYLNSIYEIISKSKEYEEFTSCYVSLNFENLMIMNNILYNKNCITNFQFKVMENYYENLKSKYTKLQNIDFPDKFCDPLMFTEIKTPVFLPDTEIIMDKEVLTRHLLNEEYNPFNREKLTIQLLENYNNNDDIKLKIEQFLREKVSSLNH